MTTMDTELQDPLVVAVMQRDRTTVQQLKNQGAFKYPSYQGALSYLVKESWFDDAHFLLSFGLDINEAYKHPYTGVLCNALATVMNNSSSDSRKVFWLLCCGAKLHTKAVCCWFALFSHHEPETITSMLSLVGRPQCSCIFPSMKSHQIIPFQKHVFAWGVLRFFRHCLDQHQYRHWVDRAYEHSSPSELWDLLLHVAIPFRISACMQLFTALSTKLAVAIRRLQFVRSLPPHVRCMIPHAALQRFFVAVANSDVGPCVPLLVELGLRLDEPIDNAERFIVPWNDSYYLLDYAVSTNAMSVVCALLQCHKNSRANCDAKTREKLSAIEASAFNSLIEDGHFVTDVDSYVLYILWYCYHGHIDFPLEEEQALAEFTQIKQTCASYFERKLRCMYMMHTRRRNVRGIMPCHEWRGDVIVKVISHIAHSLDAKVERYTDLFAYLRSNT